MGLSNWFSDVPFNMVPANAQGEPSTGPRETSSAADADDNDRSAEGQDQQAVVFDPNAPRIVLPMEPEPAYTIFAGQELPKVQQPYVNPLAGMINRPDPELSEEEKMDAYAEMMERFRAGDPEAPLETKSYWPSETGPVTREHFDEYKAWAEDQIRKANTLSLESASTLWKQARELTREKKVREDTEKMLTAQRTALQSGTVHGWVTEDRGALRKPRYTNPDNTEEREAERGRFLSKNRSWRMKELRVTILLLRAQVAVANEEPSKALDRLYEAQKLAVLLFRFPALEARCEFWRGRAEFSVDSYDTALAAFQKALPCVGVYREGLEVKEWIRRAQDGLGHPPEPPTRTRSLRRRPRPDSFVGGGEHPPRFDVGDKFNDEDDNTGKHSSKFGLGEKSNTGEGLKAGENRPRFNLDDEFDDEEEDKEMIEELMQDLGYTPQGATGDDFFDEDE